MTSFFHLFLARILLVYQSCHKPYRLKISYSNLSQIQNLSRTKALFTHHFRLRLLRLVNRLDTFIHKMQKSFTKILSCVTVGDYNLTLTLFARIYFMKDIKQVLCFRDQETPQSYNHYFKGKC